MTTDYKPAPPKPNKVYQDLYVSKNAFLPISDDMSTEVYITEIKNRFGNIDAHIFPVRGHGSQWVLASRLTDVHVPN